MNTQIKIVLISILPSGRGGMENMILTLIKQSQLIGNIELFFFDFHNGKNKNFNITSDIYLPNPIAPRIFQEISIVREFRYFLTKTAPDVVLCLDDKSCQIAYVATVLTKKRKWQLASWLHRSIHTYKSSSAIKRMDFHIAISSGIKSQLEHIGINSKDIYLLMNCNTAQTKVPLPEYITTSEKIHFIYIGRIQFEDQKNLKELLLGFSKLDNISNYHLDIIGSGPVRELQKCKDFCNALNIKENVTFHGWHHDAWDYLYRINLHNIAALCLTSTYEGFPLVLIEAISQGIFCISSDCQTGPKDIINNNNGILYPVGDTDQLSLAMLQAVTNKLNRSQIKQTSFQYSKHQYTKKFKTIMASRLKEAN